MAKHLRESWTWSRDRYPNNVLIWCWCWCLTLTGDDGILASNFVLPNHRRDLLSEILGALPLNNFFLQLFKYQSSSNPEIDKSTFLLLTMGNAENTFNTAKERKRKTPKPLPERRSRALTITTWRTAAAETENGTLWNPFKKPVRERSEGSYSVLMETLSCP